MEYQIIEEDTVEHLTGRVVAAIAEGWKPLGGVSVSLTEDDRERYFVCAQAMTRETG